MKIVSAPLQFQRSDEVVTVKKKIISIILFLSLLMSAFPVLDIGVFTANATDVKRQGDYEYIVISGREVTITSYMGKDRNVVVPSEIDGLPVTEIGNHCFNGTGRKVSYNSTESENHPNRFYNKRIKSVTIPSTVKIISEEAFGEMDNLQNVYFSEGLERIEVYAFAECPKLEKIKLPESLVYFNMNSFQETAIEEIVLGKNVTEPVLREFKGSKIKRIICNAPTVYFKRVELNYDTSLEEVVCNGQFLGGDFIGNNTMKRIVCNGHVNYSEIVLLTYKGFYFNCDSDGNNKVFTKDNKNTNEIYEAENYRYCLNEKSQAVITQYMGNEKEVIIPSELDGHTVTELAPLSFSYLKTPYPEERISVTIPDTVEKIGICAFAYNINLKSVKLSSKLRIIPDECFESCRSLENINFPDSVKEIHFRAFEDCVSLENINFSSQLHTLGKFSFYNCESITSLTFPESLKEIGPGAFKNCENLKSVDMLYIEKTGNEAFYNCRKLEKINYSQKLKKIGSGVFLSCSISGTLDLSAVEEIGSCAFMHCDIKKVILNDNLKRLEYGTFQGCASLAEVNFPSQLEYIGDCCFRSTKITEVNLGDKLKEIGALAFDGCKSLSEIKLPEYIEKIGNFAFESTSVSTLIIPETLSVIGYGAFADCKALETVFFNAMNCTIGPYMHNDTELDFGNLKDTSPFYGCNIKEIYLGAGITSIGGTSDTYGAFENCESLEEIVIPDTVSQIGKASFKNCSSLEIAVISDSVTSVADDAFDGCEKLTIVCFKDSYIHEYALNNGITVSTFLVSPIPNQTYTGKKITPPVDVTFSGEPLHKYIDFGVTYENNINVGEADVIVKGKGDYKAFSNKTKFSIVTKNITSATISPVADQAYTGNEIMPDVIVTDSSGLLCKDKDYTVSYSGNKKEGTATITVTGIGNYSGTVSAEFEIVKMNDTENFFSRMFSSIKAFFVKVGAFFKGIFT